MSHSAIYLVYKTTARQILEYNNGYGTAYVLWAMLSEKYLGGRQAYYSDAGLKALWGLYKRQNIPEHLRLCHIFTFDNAVCHADDLCRLADACDKTFYDLDAFNNNTVNHWRDLATDLRKIKNEPRLLGIGLTCTSVADAWANHARSKGKAAEPWDIITDFDRA